MKPLIAAAITVAGIAGTPTPAIAQDGWTTMLLPGGVSAARAVLDLRGSPDRVDEFFLADFTRQFFATSTDAPEITTFRRYVTLLDQVTTAAATWPEGFSRPSDTTPRADRDRAKRFIELLGLTLASDLTVSAGKSAEARERQGWLLAAGVDTQAMLEPLNAGASVVVTIPQGELPLPLPDFWKTINSRQSPLLTIISSRQSALFYTALLDLDSQTVKRLATNPALSAQLRSKYAAEYKVTRRETPQRDWLAEVLERLAVTDPGVVTATMRAAQRFDDDGKGDALRPLAQWQLMLALIEQVAVRQRWDAGRVTSLVRLWANAAGAPGSDAHGRAGEWLVDVLLPALAPDVARDDLEVYERDVIVAVSKRDFSKTPPVKVFWEGIEYIVDDTFATTRDVLTIRVSQQSPTVGDVVRLRELLRRLEAGLGDLAQVAEISADVTRVMAATAKLRGRDGSEQKIAGEFRKVDKAIREISSDRQIADAAAQIPRVRKALDALLEGALLHLVYAMAVSPAGVAPSALVDLPHWHTWEKAAWQPARRGIGPFMESVITGSVIGLDIAMADSRLRAAGRPAIGEKPTTQDRVGDVTLLRSLRAHSEPAAWVEDAPRILKALAAGDAIIKASGSIPADVETQMRDAGIAPDRIAMARWQRERGVPVERQAFTRLDAYRLGTSDPLPRGWSASDPLTEVVLRLLEGTQTWRLPAGIVPALVPLAAHDWLVQARAVTRERIETYMLGLVSARLLMRPARSQHP